MTSSSPGLSPSEADAAAAPVTSDKLYVNGVAEPMWRRRAPPGGAGGAAGGSSGEHLTALELEYYVEQFDKVGSWEGGLNWYRVMDHDWHSTAHLAGKRLQQQTVWFVGGCAAQYQLLSTSSCACACTCMRLFHYSFYSSKPPPIPRLLRFAAALYVQCVHRYLCWTTSKQTPKSVHAGLLCSALCSHGPLSCRAALLIMQRGLTTWLCKCLAAKRR